jgi:hypothetical protein
MKLVGPALTVAVAILTPIPAAGAATPPPKISHLEASPAVLTYHGGKVKFTAHVAHAKKCTFSVTPKLPGSPATVRCARTAISKTIVFPTNSTGVRRTYRVSLRAGKSTARTSVSIAAAPASLFTFSAPKQIDLAQNAPASVSCPTSTFCAAVDEAGNALTYNGSHWSAPQGVDVGNELTAVSCSSAEFCLAMDSSGNALFYNGSGWTDPEAVANAILGPAPITSVSCTSAVFCVAVDSSHSAYIYDGAGWTTDLSVTDPGTNSVSCTSPTFCVDVTKDGTATFYNGAGWGSPEDVDSNGGLNSISCPTSRFCLAVDTRGSYLTYSGSTWSSPLRIDTRGSLNSVSCPTMSFCAAVDGRGHALTYDRSGWSAPVDIEPYAAKPASVSCPTSASCEIVDRSGNVLVGRGARHGSKRAAVLGFDAGTQAA